MRKHILYSNKTPFMNIFFYNFQVDNLYLRTSSDLPSYDDPNKPGTLLPYRLDPSGTALSLSLKVCQHIFENFFIIWLFIDPQKIFNHQHNIFLRFNYSETVITLTKSASFMNCPIWGPLNIPPFILTILSFANFLRMYNTIIETISWPRIK